MKEKISEWIKGKSELDIVDKIYELYSLRINKEFCYFLTQEVDISKKVLDNKKLEKIYIEVFKSILFNDDSVSENDLKNQVSRLSITNKHLEKKIESLEKELYLEKEKNSIYEEREKRRCQGKKHIRGSQEFYDEILNANELAVSKTNKSGKEYVDYRATLKYAKQSEAIIEYATENRLEINRENLKRWYEVAKSLKYNTESKISIGKARK